MLCYRKMILLVCHREINEFQTLCVRFKAVEIIKLCYDDRYCMNKMGLNIIEMCLNLVLV